MDACPAVDTVIVFVGMNDAVNPRSFLTPQETQTNVLQMIKFIAEAHARAVVVTVHQPDVGRLLQRHALAEYGSRLPQERIEDADASLKWAAQQGEARSVDFRTLLVRAGGATASLSTDGVHLTREGYRLLALAVSEAISKDAKQVLCIGDSLTYGIGVRAANTPDAGSASYPQQLQALLSGAL